MQPVVDKRLETFEDGVDPPAGGWTSRAQVRSTVFEYGQTAQAA